ncbi:MAG: SusC/RagA family TonB-linked outer membrane protein [Gemmatimonadota bacterium]|nr:SusC/RagA family TonB-linked outer membrane protein [Gemmatimonadota bacterium]
MLRGYPTRTPLLRTHGLVLLLLLITPAALEAQTGVVAGIVVDARTQQPIAGVQINVVGTSIGAATTEDGRFRLGGLSGAQVALRLRRVGFTSRTENVPVGSTDLRLTMSEAPRLLEEVVVTGTAEPVERRALGHAVTKVNAAEVQSIAPAQSTSSLINARAPSVVMIAGSGAVGSGPRIRIRGSSSFSLTDQPLIYVDGVRIANDISTGPTSQFFGSAVISRLNDINPDDIESIEVVKGPAAATLYGTEANNGVIQIITKQGRAGRAMFSLTAREGRNWFNDAERRIGYNYSRNPTTGAIERWSAVEQERLRGTPLFRSGPVRAYDLGVSGGMPQVRYHLSLGYDNEHGIEPTNRMWRYNGRANVSIAPRQNFDINASVGTVQSKVNVPLEAGGGMWFSAFFGQTPRTPADQLRRGFFSAPPEAFWQAFNVYQRVARTTTSVTLNHRPFGWLNHRLTAGNDMTGEDNVDETERMGPELRQFFTNPVTQSGTKLTRRRELTVTSVDYVATARATLPRGITSSTSGGAQFFRRNTYALAARGEGFPAAGLTQVDAAAVTFGGEAFVTNSTLGFYLQEQLGWRERLFLTAALRVDDNSAFGENFSWVQYPKVGASWVISEEPWWGGIGSRFFSALKLRAAYGETGQQPQTFSALRTYTPITGGDNQSAVTANSPGNPDLRPERGREFEAGFDASALGDRINVEFNVYRRQISDAILDASVAPSSGFAGTRVINVGKIRGNGIEFSTRANILDRPNFGLDATLNVSHNDNEVLDIGAPPGTPVDQQFIGTGNIRHQVGYPVGGYWDRRILSAEFNADGTTRNAMCDDGRGGATPCLNAAGAVIAPRVFMGRSDAPNEGSFSTTATLYSRFRLYALVDWKTGHRQFDNNHRARCQVFRLCPANLEPLNHDPVLIAQYDSPNLLREVFYGNAGYAKLREVSGSYMLPQAWAARMRATAATVTVSGRNLRTWTKWTGVDPESFFTLEQFARTEQAQVPPLQQFLFSLNVTF